MKKTKGFTLSEILIALLVLGIIVSSSVPVIMKLAPNKNVAMIKKAYYTTETIVSSLINDPYYYPDQSIHCQGGKNSGDLNSETGGTCYYGFDNPVQVYVNESIQTQNDADKKLRCLFASKLNIKEDLTAICNGTYTGYINTMDGITWQLQGIASMKTNDNSSINIDVDGANNGVNAYSLSNKKGLCANNTAWGIAGCDKDLTTRIKKNFDRIEIVIARDGKLSIREKSDGTLQQDFIDIISGKKKVISGDDD